MAGRLGRGRMLWLSSLVARRHNLGIGQVNKGHGGGITECTISPAWAAVSFEGRLVVAPGCLLVGQPSRSVLGMKCGGGRRGFLGRLL